MKVPFKILTTTAIAAALIAGGIAGAAPAMAAAPAASIDLSQVPAQFEMPVSGCVQVPFVATITGGVAGGDYSIDGDMTDGTTYGITIGNNTPIGNGYDDAGVPQAMYAYICSNLSYAGPQTLTFTLRDYENSDASGNPLIVTVAKPVYLHGNDAGLKISSVSGKKGHTITFKGYTTTAVIGTKVKVYYKKSGSKKYKLIGHATVKADKFTGGTFTYKKKLTSKGALYVKSAATAKVVAGKSKVFKFTFGF